jgi:hypothetical protein
MAKWFFIIIDSQGKIGISEGKKLKINGKNWEFMEKKKNKNLNCT